jgi:FG-GAP-like repeat/Bacterial Ig-like domain
MRKSLTTIVFMLALAACSVAPQPVNPNPGSTPNQTVPVNRKVLGLIEVEFSGIGNSDFTATAKNIKPARLTSRALTDVPYGLQLSKTPTARGFSDKGKRGVDGQRYMYVSFKVRNASVDGKTVYGPQSNLTMVAVETVSPAPATAPGTSIQRLKNFAGTTLTTTEMTAMAASIQPAAPVTLGIQAGTPEIVRDGHDALQVMSETDAAALKTLLSPSSTTGVKDVFPFGFVVTNLNDKSRTLPAPSSVDDFAGVVTFAVKLPMQVTPDKDPFSFTMMFEVVTEDVTRVTQSLEGQDTVGTAAIEARAAQLNASLTTVGGSNTGNPECIVRTAGSVSNPLQFLANTQAIAGFSPALNARNVDANSNITANFPSAMNIWNSSSLTVNGSQTGLRSGTYSGDNTTTLSFDPGREFKPGEEVEVRLGKPISSKAGQGICREQAWRFRAKTAAGGGQFIGARTAINEYAQAVQADFNADGKMDFAGLGSSAVSVQLAKEGLSFQPKTDYSTSLVSYSFDLMVGDFNGDLRPDLIVTGRRSSDYQPGINVFINDSSNPGTFLPRAEPAAGTSFLKSPVVADINSDNNLDIVALNGDSSTNKFLVYRGKGDGTFQTAQSSGSLIPNNQANRLTIGDVNRDGKQDLIAANTGTHSVSVFLGNNDGTFSTTRTDYSTGSDSRPQDVLLKDLNGDTYLDLMVSTITNNGSIGVMLGKSDGTFDALTSYAMLQRTPLYGIYTASDAMKLADINGDGKWDLIVAEPTNQTVAVLIGNGTGGFQAPIGYEFQANTASIALTDANGDTVPDLFVILKGIYTASAQIALNNGTGTFELTSPLGYETGTKASKVSVADINADGNLDVVSVGSDGTTLASVMLGNGDGTLQSKQEYSLTKNATDLQVADFNADGKLDLVTANLSYSGTSSVSILLGDGNGSFSSNTEIPTGTDMTPQAVVVADLNADGKQDVVVGHSTYSSNPPLVVLLGKGDGTFETSIGYSGFKVNAIQIADMNADGRQDIVIADRDANKIGLFPGKGNGTFKPGVTISTGKNASSLAIADLNDDDRPDVAVVGGGSGVVYALINNANGTFTSQSIENPGSKYSFSRVVAVDLNGDQKMDFIAHGAAQNPTMFVFIGNGNGTFAPMREYFTTTSTTSIAAGDLNNDGRLEIVTGNSDYYGKINRVQVFINKQ